MAFSKLIAADTNSITPARAAAALLAEINRLVRVEGLSLDQAWSQVKAQEPDLYAKISEKAAPSVDDGAPLENSLPAPLGANKAFYLPAMKLPANTPDDAFAACWRANGGKATPLHAQDCFNALVSYLAQTKKLSVAAARREALDNYPSLSAAAGQSDDPMAPALPAKLPAPPLPRTTTF